MDNKKIAFFCILLPKNENFNLRIFKSHSNCLQQQRNQFKSDECLEHDAGSQ